MVVGEFTHETDLLVIGGGPGGYTAAFKAAMHGIQTTIVESTPALGGVCLHCGCIPSKTLLGIGEMLHLPEHAKQMGLSFSKPKLDLDGVNTWKTKTIDKLARGLGAVAKKLKVEVLKGTARFEDGRTVAVTGGEVPRVKFKRAIVAAGSRPVVLRDIQIDSPRVVDSTGALELKEIPKSALVVGGGIIGLELGSVLAALGTEVTVVEMMPSLIPGCDPDLARPLIKRLEKACKEIALETRVTGMKEKKTGIEVAFDGKNVPARKTYEQVLVAVARPNADQLDVQKAGIGLNERGFIEVDSQMRTSNPRIFALGDIIGEPMLAHKAIAEAKVVAAVLGGDDQAVFEPRGIPSVVYTDPEIAWVGLTEVEAKAEGTPIEVKKMQWVASGRATAMGRTDGLTKIIFEPETQRVLGIGIVGAHAGELIAEGALALEMGAVAADISTTIHPHPTVSELVGEVADMMLAPGGAATH